MNSSYTRKLRIVDNDISFESDAHTEDINFSINESKTPPPLPPNPEIRSRHGSHNSESIFSVNIPDIAKESSLADHDPKSDDLRDLVEKQLLLSSQTRKALEDGFNKQVVARNQWNSSVPATPPIIKSKTTSPKLSNGRNLEDGQELYSQQDLEFEISKESEIQKNVTDNNDNAEFDASYASFYLPADSNNEKTDLKNSEYGVLDHEELEISRESITPSNASVINSINKSVQQTTITSFKSTFSPTPIKNRKQLSKSGLFDDDVDDEVIKQKFVEYFKSSRMEIESVREFIGSLKYSNN